MRKPRRAAPRAVALPLAALLMLGSSAIAATDASTAESASAAEAEIMPTLAAEFAPLGAPRAEIAVPAHAVDLDTIETPVEAESFRSAGSGSASFYADRFNGRRTASGEAFSNSAMTAAHRTLPFGTMVRVTNPANGKSVTVRINDRGPFTRGRLIDVSRAAASELGFVGRGHANVVLDIVE